MACEGIQKAKPDPTLAGSGRNAFAIHGRLGARVALLQSPILPNANGNPCALTLLRFAGVGSELGLGGVLSLLFLRAYPGVRQVRHLRQ